MRIAPFVLAFVVAAACSGGSPGPTVEVGGDSIPARRLKAAAAGVCEAADRLPASPKAARTVFFGQAHDDLHTIARALSDVDRKAAADLLVAKQAVEADFSEDASPGRLAADLGRLAATTRSGLDRLGVDVPAC